MNTQSFYTKLNPKKTSFRKDEIAEITQIQQEFPYFQLARMLNLKAMQLSGHNDFRLHLSQTATLVLDREVLFDFVYPDYGVYQQSKKPLSATAKTASSTTKIKEAKEIRKPKPLTDKEGKEISSKAVLMEEVKSRLQEIEKEKHESSKEVSEKVPKEIVKNISKKAAEKTISKATKKTVDEKSEETKIKVSTSTIKKIKSKDKEPTKKHSKTVDRGSTLGIIDSFIKNSPGINRPEDKDYSKEVDLASQSVKETYELVSETMAELYFKQGHTKKAIKIYEKLILIYPEKITYFAARISELKD